MSRCGMVCEVFSEGVQLQARDGVFALFVTVVRKCSEFGLDVEISVSY